MFSFQGSKKKALKIPHVPLTIDAYLITLNKGKIISSHKKALGGVLVGVLTNWFQRTNRIYLFILRNWLTQLWSLTSPQTCDWQAGDPGEPMV